jgi:hypothetical protein
MERTDMTWHYQIMRHSADRLDGGQEVWYEIHEFYPKDRHGAYAYSEPVTIFGESVDELKKMLKMVEQDIYRHGVIDIKTMEKVSEN